MEPEAQRAIDTRIQAYYASEFDEHSRLGDRSAQGPLEFERTQEVIAAHVPVGRILDAGGGTGRHAVALQARGCVVQLIDPVRRHVDLAARAGVAARLGTALDLPFGDDEFDAVLLLGPLYHLARLDDRLRALREAHRVTRPGGVVIAAAISRFIAFGSVFLGRASPEPLPPAWSALLAAGRAPSGPGFPAGHFHTGEELEDELRAAGLTPVEVVGVEGPAGLLLESTAAVAPEVVAAARVLAAAAAAVPGIRDFSPHLLGVARVPSDRVGDG